MVSLGLCVAAACGDGRQEPDTEISVPASIDRQVVEGGPNPAAVMVQVSNRGNCALDLLVSAVTTDGAAWLSVAPASVTIAAGTSSALTVSFDVVTSELFPGNYVGSIILTGTCTTTGQAARGSPRVISVNLRVTPVGAGIAVDPDHIEVDVTALNDEWLPMAANNLSAGRSSHTAVWTGREMWVFGGLDLNDDTLARGSQYDALIDSWFSMPGPAADVPAARYRHTAVWTGSEMIIWGGQTSTTQTSVVASGGRLGSSWTPTGSMNQPSARAGHSAVWTGTEMIVFGGIDSSGAALDTGGRYNPSTDMWMALPTAGAPASRGNHAAVWTGEFMFVWGGENGAGVERADGARYDPVADRWSSMASGGPVRALPVSAWTGSHWIVYGGEAAGLTYADGGMYSLSEDAWSDVPADTQRRSDFSAAVWTGRQMIVWGGTSGRVFTPGTSTWSAVTTLGQPSTRQAASAVWTGNTMILYGGDFHADGAVYR